MTRTARRIAMAPLALAGALWLMPVSDATELGGGETAAVVQKPLTAQLYELRVYTTNPGLLPNLHERFENHTNALFVKHGMRLIGYWTPAAEDNKLIYILAFPNQEAREKSWTAFREDPEWQEVSAASKEEAGGDIVAKVESTLMNPTEYSPIR